MTDTDIASAENLTLEKLFLRSYRYLKGTLTLLLLHQMCTALYKTHNIGQVPVPKSFTI